MNKQTIQRRVSASLLLLCVAGTMGFAGIASAQAVNSTGGYGGTPTDRVAVCREIGSRFNPYIKVTVPEFVADRWVARGDAVWPDTNGRCPQAEQTLRQYIQERLAGIFSRWGNR